MTNMTQRDYSFYVGLLFSILLASCAHRGQQPSSTMNMVRGSANAQATVESEEAVEVKLNEKEASSEAVEENVVKPYKPTYGEIAMDDHQLVEKWIQYFQGKGRERMTTYLERSTRYLPMMKNVLRENGLPEELVYIALIESGFSPRAHSRSNAVGYWQFIRETGRRYGLKVDTFIDERRDPVLSTRAAVEYFKALYNLFGSWHLAMASYNCGEGRVKRAVMKHKTRNFWDLIAKRRALPNESKHYVPKFIAAAKIAMNPEKYGFTDIKFQDPLSYDTVTLTNPISLAKLASNVGVDADELKLLNPKFRTDYVPMARDGETVVRLPVGMGQDATAALSMSVTTQPKIVASEYIYYRIRSGDSLSTIARRHRTTVSQIRRLNDLSNRAMLRVGTRLRLPDKGGVVAEEGVEEDANTPSTRSSRSSNRQAANAETVAAVMTTAGAENEFHTVRRGDNLSNIAQRYSLSVPDLLKLNNLTNRSVLKPGQKIRVKGDAVDKSAKGLRFNSSKQRSVASVNKPAGKKNVLSKAQTTSQAKKISKVSQKAQKKSHKATKVVHKVRAGETLERIAKKYGVTMPQIARANALPRSGRVLAGAELVIPR